MYYIILYQGKFGDTSSNQKMNRQYTKNGKKTNNGRQNTMQKIKRQK